MTEALSPTPSVPARTDPLPAHSDRLRAVAEQLEAGFLSEMLKATGLGAAGGSFGGGTGEGQFASFLRDAQATEMARAGGIGLAESLFKAMQARDRG